MNILSIILILITFVVLVGAVIVELLSMLLLGIILMLGDIIKKMAPAVYEEYFTKMLKRIKHV